MTDLVFVAIVLAFVALCVAYIAWCDRIIGPDESVAAVEPTSLGDTEVIGVAS
jgi:hypothetical protein